MRMADLHQRLEFVGVSKAYAAVRLAADENLTQTFHGRYPHPRGRISSLRERENVSNVLTVAQSVSWPTFRSRPGRF
jgi:hypothetical protein